MLEQKKTLLRQTISKLTKTGQFQGQNGAISFEKVNLSLFAGNTQDHSKEEIVEAYSAASSTYYSASGNAWAHFRATPWNGWWLVRTFWYLWAKAQPMSNKMVKLAGGIENLTADQLDIRASIARKCGQHDEARRCVEEAVTRPNLADNTRVLLLLHCVNEARREGIQSTVSTIFGEIDEIVKRGNVSAMTQVRGLRAGASWMRETGAPEEQIKFVLEEIERIAKLAGLDDQVVKARAKM